MRGGTRRPSPSGKARRGPSSPEVRCAVINGSKTFFSNGQNCDLVIAVVKTDLAAQLRHRGISLVLPSVSRSDASARHACCPESAHCARQAAASKGSAKYCVSCTTWPARNFMMLTVSYGFPS